MLAQKLGRSYEKDIDDKPHSGRTAMVVTSGIVKEFC
jgi:hypothetical protein